MGHSGITKLRRFLKYLIPRRIRQFGWHGYYYIQNNWLRTLVGCQTNQKVIALTFDDGPNLNSTRQILDILLFYQIKATFFLLGKNILNYPETARGVVDAGHAIGNHAFTHTNLASQDLKFVVRELSACQQAIQESVGVKTKIMRPPYGAQDIMSYTTTRMLGFTIVHWTISGEDYRADLAHTIAQRILKNVQPGNIVLLHDGWELPPNQTEWREEYTKFRDRSTTIESLPLIIEPLQNQGYKFITIPDMIRKYPLIYKNWE
jgi:peptidoglycan/xylan/chitin deacetylase (PgdA/CDA1 family)